MIKIDFSKRLGTLKPINGIDNGPVCFGSLIDSTEYYKQAAFPYVRLHDTNYPHPREVDIPTIFKDFSADPDDPASYSFEATDIYLQEIVATGAKIIYRLGVSIEHPKLKYFVDPPSDYEKWAKICLNIARHYNEGWANGFHMGIEYWEVWNEPDQLAEERSKDVMWSGTPKQYYELYAVTAAMFKKHMPNVKIGGYAAVGVASEKHYKFFTDFLTYVKERALPLDFFSWHVYASSLDDIRNNACIAREELDKFGFRKAESMLNEWNYLVAIPNMWDEIFTSAHAKQKVFLEASGIIGTSFTAAALIEMIDLPIDIATFYDGQPTNLFCTIFDRFGLPTKQFYAFDAFNRLKECGERAELICEIPGVYGLATASDGKTGILLANWEGRTAEYPCEIAGLDAETEYMYELYLLDEALNLEKEKEIRGQPNDLPGTIFLHNRSVALITFTRI